MSSPAAPQPPPPANLVELLLRLATDPRVVARVGQGYRSHGIGAALIIAGVMQLAGVDVGAAIQAHPEPTYDNPTPAVPAAPSGEMSLMMVLNGLGLMSLRSAVGRRPEETTPGEIPSSPPVPPPPVVAA